MSPVPQPPTDLPGNPRLMALARKLLMISVDDVQDPWLWDHAERTARLASKLLRDPEIASRSPDADAVLAGVWLAAAGWAEQFRAGQVQRSQLLARPTNDLQRELAASIVHEQAAALLTPRSLRLASESIRQSGQRQTQMAEAQVLSDARNLDELGTLYIARHLRAACAEGRSLSQLVITWQRQSEYNYWQLRLNDFHFETARVAARHRIQSSDSYIRSLALQISGDDLASSPAALASEPPATA